MYDSQYTPYLKILEKAREAGIALPQRRNAEERAQLLRDFHPDGRAPLYQTLCVGANRGERVPCRLAELLQAHSVVDATFDVSVLPNTETDVLVIGGGGAGAAAALEAHRAGARVLLVTKLRFGDSNTVMAEGGIQAATGEDDSPTQHFLDTYGGGGFVADRTLVAQLVKDGPETIGWLRTLGVVLDVHSDGTLRRTHGGGISRQRMHAARDATGAEIMRTLREEVLACKIPVWNYTSAIELLTECDGGVAGAVLQNTATGERTVVRSKTVILATGGAGQLHYGGFPTSNHHGATADGLVLGYRVGARLVAADSLQYHPTGAAYPQMLCGTLVTEKVRALGAPLLNRKGQAFVHPLEPRDVTTAAILRECEACDGGVPTPAGPAVWLDTPTIERIGGEGTVKARIPSTMNKFLRVGIDIRREPILVRPTLHYQNGGIEINSEGRVTTVERLFAAGEVTGGIHGRNRLMGNALLEILVFGRRAGRAAAEVAKEIPMPTEGALSHLKQYEQALRDANISTEKTSPQLLPGE